MAPRFQDSIESTAVVMGTQDQLGSKGTQKAEAESGWVEVEGHVVGVNERRAKGV